MGRSTGRELPERLAAHPEHAPGATQPQVTRFVFEDVEDRVLDETVAARDLRPPPVLEPEETGAVGSEPEHAVFVFVDGFDAGPGQGDSGDVGLDPVAHESREPARGPEPHRPLAVLVHRADLVHGAVLDGIGRELARSQATEPVPGAEPQRAVTRLQEGRDDLAGKPTLGERGEAPVLEAAHPAVGGRPEDPVPVHQESAADVVAQSIGLAIGGPSPLAEAAHSGVSADPQAAIRSLGEAPGQIVDQPFAGAQARELSVTQAAQSAAVEADPEVAKGVLEDRPNEVAREPLGASQPRPAALRQPTEPVVGADPEVAVPVFGEGADLLARQAVPLREPPVGPVLPLHETAALGADPHASVARGQQRPDHLRTHLLVPQDSAHETVEAAVGAEPDGPRRVLGQGQDRVSNEPTGQRVGGDLAGVPTIDTCVRRADPQAPVAPHQEGARPLAVGPLAREAAIGPSAERSVRADPQAPVPGHREAPEVVVAELRSVLHVEDAEVRAVEADEAALGPEPEVTVGSLADRADGRERKPVAHVPLVEHILLDRLAGVEGMGGVGGGEQRGQERTGSKCGAGRTSSRGRPEGRRTMADVSAWCAPAQGRSHPQRRRRRHYAPRGRPSKLRG